MPTPVPDLLGQALQFRVAHDQPTALFKASNLALQRNLITEEYKEFQEAHGLAFLHIRDLKRREELLKELADLVYVCFQYAAAAGFELDEALARVHISNMTKLVNGKPVKNEDGKVVKGPNYQPPYLEDLI
tara:strand:+ start:577 stop:969 length:393 start_codon:yes stop_codon:yes gene_type:complete